MQSPGPAGIMVHYIRPFWFIKMIHILSVLRSILKSKRLSERRVAVDSGLSRGLIRSILSGESSVTLKSLETLLDSVGCEAMLLVVKYQGMPERSVVAASCKIEADGFDSWKIHLFDFVDEFRRSWDPRLVLLAPVSTLEPRLQALFSATVAFLCREAGMSAPDWTRRNIYLEHPWFLSGMESLKAMTILESPTEFRRHNIFVQENFLKRV